MESCSLCVSTIYQQYSFSVFRMEIIVFYHKFYIKNTIFIQPLEEVDDPIDKDNLKNNSK